MASHRLGLTSIAPLSACFNGYLHDDGGGDDAKLAKQVLEVILRGFVCQILHKYVGVLGLRKRRRQEFSATARGASTAPCACQSQALLVPNFTRCPQLVDGLRTCPLSPCPGTQMNVKGRVKAADPTSASPGRSERFRKGPTYTFLPSSSMPFTCTQAPLCPLLLCDLLRQGQALQTTGSAVRGRDAVHFATGLPSDCYVALNATVSGVSSRGVVERIQEKGCWVSNASSKPQNGSRYHLLDGLLRGVLALVVHEAVTLGLASRVKRHLAGQDVAKRREGIVQRLVVDVLVQVLRISRARNISSSCQQKKSIVVGICQSVSLTAPAVWSAPPAPQQHVCNVLLL